MNLSPASVELEAQRLLREWLGEGDVSVKRTPRDVGADFTVGTKQATLVVEVKGSIAISALGQAVQQVRAFAPKVSRVAVPVVAVPFMTEMGRRLCAEAGVSWFDLSGNADIRGPGIRIYVEGKPNRFKRRGRPSTVFAPRSSRIVRALLTAKNPVAQHDLAELSGLDEGFTSRIVRKLVEDEFVERLPGGSLRVREPSVLLDAWREQYSFEKHAVLKGHVTARSGDEGLKMIGQIFREKKVQHAVTGLGAAWLLTKFAGFRLATFFLSKEPSEKLQKDIGFREDERGANVWLVVPKDDAVFVGANEVEGQRCVHPLQAYLDLKAHPERAPEAAKDLRNRLLTWEILMAPKPKHASGYDSQQVAVVKATCLYVATKLGDLMDQVVIVGGLVPSLIIHQADIETHVGTLDLDVGLALALLDGHRYEELARRLRQADFSPDENEDGQPTRQRWRLQEPHRVTVDFLMPPTRPEATAGSLLDIESDLAAIITPGLHLAFVDQIPVELDGLTVLKERAKRTVRVCGPGAFVVLKALAFRNRGENKDAYDLVYVLRNFGSRGVRDVAERLRTFRDDPAARLALGHLREDFSHIDSVGPMRVTDFLHGRRDDNLQADARGLVLDLLEELGG